MTARVVFLIRLHPGSERRFLEAYEAVRHDVADGVPGHVVDQLCQRDEGTDEWLITSEWARLDDFLAWERSDEHRTMVRPLRDCIAEATSLRFLVRAETRAGTAVAS
ncbi:MAG TPA: antibiotic biosynthesis monooxygenase family protein [Acidimicrobiales bacterium]|nr:antibiotic biosynthesis monooxygenase family protein [Acidimicrobiales bacterium]